MTPTPETELDRLDLIVAKAIGWPTVEKMYDAGAIGGPCICLALNDGLNICGPDGNWGWSPTRNANHRDEVVEWLVKSKNYPL